MHRHAAAAAAVALARPRRRLVRLRPWAFSSSSSSRDDQNKKNEEEEKDKDTSSSAAFPIVAADAASHRPTRRFNVSSSSSSSSSSTGTGGEPAKPKVQVFRDLTRNRDPFWERGMEHTTFISHLPKQLQQYEEEQMNNPLVRDQSRLIIRKDDPANRRWLSVPIEEHTTSNYLEREALARQARLGQAQGAVLRKKAGWMDGEGGGMEEGLSVEEKIQLAMAQGDFDDLKGKGKPLERLESHEGPYSHDQTSHKYMDVLAKSGVKPPWVDRSIRIKKAQTLLLRRVEAEWAKLVLEEEKVDRRRWKERMEGLRCLEDDLGFVNAEIDTYNLQVPSMSLQRMRLSLAHLLEVAASDEDDRMDRETARKILRAAERDGLMSNVTALGNVRVEVEEARGGSRRRKGEEGGGKEGWYGGRKEGRGGGGGGGLLDTLTSWFSGGSGAGKR